MPDKKNIKKNHQKECETRNKNKHFCRKNFRKSTEHHNYIFATEFTQYSKKKFPRRQNENLMPNEWLGKTNESFFIVLIFWNRFFVQSLLLSIEIGFVYAFALLVMYRSKCFDCILIFAILLVFPSYWMFPFEPQTIIFVTFLIFFSLLQFDINQSANKRTIMLNSSNSNRTENLICKWISCFFFFSFHPHWLWPKHSCFYNNCLHLANVVVENRFNLIWKFFSKMYFDVEWPNLRFSEYWTIIPIVLNRNEHKDVGNERAKSIKITDGKTDSAGLFKLLFFFFWNMQKSPSKWILEPFSLITMRVINNERFIQIP